MADPNFWAERPVCVLGGSGFLGAHIVRQLVDLSAKVRTLSLPPPAPPWSGVEALTGDVRDAIAVRAAVGGVRVVFLAAGPVGVGPAVSRATTAHTAGLRTVLDALHRDARLVLTSSIVAVGGTRAGDVLTEDSPFTPAALNVGYVRAKRAAEVDALASGRDVVVVNPGYLFGPDDPGPSIMGEFCRRFWRGRVPLAPPGGINCVDVRDVAAGHLLAAERGTAGRRYILGGVNLSFAELVAQLADAADMRPRWLPRAPQPLFTGLAVWNEGLSRLSGKDPVPSLEHARMHRLYWFHSSARAEAELDFRTRPLAETLADAFAWHAAHSGVTPRGFNRWWFRPAA